jgi:hypothetical protein
MAMAPVPAHAEGIVEFEAAGGGRAARGGKRAYRSDSQKREQKQRKKSNQPVNSAANRTTVPRDRKPRNLLGVGVPDHSCSCVDPPAWLWAGEPAICAVSVSAFVFSF